jgi:hypothetical protein
VFNKQEEQQKPFYVGVTYCGSSVQEAKELIDKVKNYTNLFTLLSGNLKSTTEFDEIGDYAVASNLNFIIFNSENVYYSNTNVGMNEWVNIAKERWKEKFVGIYFNDEPGGEMLDNFVYFTKKQ